MCKGKVQSQGQFLNPSTPAFTSVVQSLGRERISPRGLVTVVQGNSTRQTTLLAYYPSEGFMLEDFLKIMSANYHLGC